jgi:hypothetical protein
MQHSETIGSLATAKARAQANFAAVDKDQSAEVFSQRTGRTFTYTYADLANCLAAVVPALSKEGLALFQPIRYVEEPDAGLGSVTVTTLLVHGESGEWIREDLSCPVADPKDPRSIGSAATYGRRYALLGLLGVASSEEDDDAQAARGGAHEMQKPIAAGAMTCPKCGVTGSIQKNRDGSWSCWRSKGGCEAKFDLEPGPIEVTKPEPRYVLRDTVQPEQPELMPTKTPPAPQAQASQPEEEALCAATNDDGYRCILMGPHKDHEFPKPQPAPEAPKPTPTRSPSRPRPAPREASKGGTPPSSSPPVEAPAENLSLPTTEPAPEPAPAPPAAPAPPQAAFSQIKFTIGPPGKEKEYITNGITQAQLLKTFSLQPALDRLRGKDFSRNILRRMYKLDTRTQLDEQQAVTYIAALEKALAEAQP